MKRGQTVVSIPKLEMHVTDACTLRCTGCTHYADHGLRGRLDLAIGRASLEAWGTHITPARFSLLGGEPLLHPDVADFVRIARTAWPLTELRLVTNGLLLPRREELWAVLAATQTILTVSVHSRAAAYLSRMDPVLRLARRRSDEFGVRLDVRDCTEGWYKLYRGAGAAMRPFAEHDARGSWLACQTKHCITLRDNALWKCPPIAHLPVVAARHHLDANAEWQPYLRYQPLTLPASDDAIREFVARPDEPICQMCPTDLRSFQKSVDGEPAPW